ncbi:conserved hypothetical protein [Ricinus communis]|uniref:Uncharacterized protein n=1 Tax=Ricinus communis TaxID=3988 RepID=B9SYC5_RICCO|nr:conserved hypothetical protein [Ricinus communis]
MLLHTVALVIWGWRVMASHGNAVVDFISPSNAWQPKFRFKNAWLREQECQDLVSSVWNAFADDGIQGHISIFGRSLLKWGSDLKK